MEEEENEEVEEEAPKDETEIQVKIQQLRHSISFVLAFLSSRSCFRFSIFFPCSFALSVCFVLLVGLLVEFWLYGSRSHDTMQIKTSFLCLRLCVWIR